MLEIKRKRSSVTILLVVSAVLFGMAFKCGGDSQTVNGFEHGHSLIGRYVNTDNGIRSFTFATKGTFSRGGASSGSFRGGEYSTGSHETGTYELSQNTLMLTYTNGDTEELSIEIFDCCAPVDYSKASPGQLKINHVLYANAD